MKCSILLLLVLVAFAASATVQGRHHPPQRFSFKLPFKFPFWQAEDGKSTEKNDQCVMFRLFNRDNANSPEVVDSRHLQPFKHLRAGRPIKVIIHGWRGYEDCSFTKGLREALLKTDVNVIAVDWSAHGSRSNMYPTASGNVPAVGAKVAQLLDSLAGSGVNLSNVHVMGHSLGGQIAGVAGHLVRKGKIGRITGFDPAGPSFSMENKAGRLSPESASFVDVIHTTAGTLGFGEPIGHADFYPNGGIMIQPGCGVDIIGKCSHRRSYEFFIESLSRPNSFPAVSCQDWAHFQKNACNGKNVVMMGINTPSSARGVYYLQTNKASSFGKDKGGLTFSA